jgi:hypothetical protein
MYCFIKLKKTACGSTAPDIHNDIDFLLIADAKQLADYELYDCSIAADTELPSSIIPVSMELNILLHSAEHFPPALAIARETIEDCLPENASIDTFSQHLVSILGDLLTRQNELPYFMGKAKTSEIGYSCSGGFYWIINYSEETKQVSWVSRDYFIYKDSIENFDVSELELQKRFNKVGC